MKAAAYLHALAGLAAYAAAARVMPLAAPSLRQLIAPPRYGRGTAVARRAAAKRRNVIRNRRAHRG